MTRLRRIAGLTSATALAFTLAACGGGSEYCDTIENLNDNVSIEGLDSGEMPTVDQANEVQDAFAEIAGVAPDDVKQNWQNLADTYQILVDAEMDPANIDPADAEGMMTIMDDIEALQTQVQEECDIDLDSL